MSYHAGPPMPYCWLELNGVMENDDRMPPCSGRLIRAHLLSRQMLLKELPAERSAAAIDDTRSWVWACGGPMGNAGHHGMFDYARTLRVPLERIPEATVELAEELGLTWWLEKTYGRRY